MKIEVRAMMRLVLLICLMAIPWVHAAEKQDEPDYLGMAALLVKGGHYERAALALQDVDTADEELDLIRYYTLNGIIELKLQRYENAVKAFQAAFDAGQDKPLIHVYVAQAYYGLRQYEQALQAIEAAGETGAAMPGVMMLKAQLYWEMGDEAASWQALQEGETRFPDNAGFARRQVFVLIQLGLYQKAAEKGVTYLTNYDGEAEDYIAIGSALRQSGQPRAALNFLEPAMMRYPDNVKAMLASAQAYGELKMYSVAAAIAEKAAGHDAQYFADAAEMYRMAGRPLRALYLNSLISDQGKKLKQRLALLLDAGRYQEVVAMEEALYRVGLLKDEDIRYALAYAAYMSTEFATAEKHLSLLTDSSLFRKATALRKAMQDCADNVWRCS